jgi:hypothetical protein
MLGQYAQDEEAGADKEDEEEEEGSSLPSYFDVMSQIKAAKSETNNTLYFILRTSFVLCGSCKLYFLYNIIAS